MESWGIDISKWQGNFDFTVLDPSFVIIKAGGSDDGLYMDSKFLHNYTTAKNAGIPCGIYWYTKAKSDVLLKEEITYLLKNIKGLQFELPIFLDIEEPVIYNLAPTLANIWLNTLPQYGYYPGIYSSWSWWHDTLKDVACDEAQRWLAFWTDTKPIYKYGIWQNGHITYNNMEIDSNYMYCDYSFIKENGMNGFTTGTKFSDVPATRGDYKAIKFCADKGWIKGYKDGTYRPDEPLTRGQLATILYRIFK